MDSEWGDLARAILHAVAQCVAEGQGSPTNESVARSIEDVLREHIAPADDKPRALRLTRGDEAPVFIRCDIVSSVERGEFGTMSVVCCPGAYHDVREPAQAIVEALGWDVVEVQYAQPPDVQRREVRVNLNAEVRCVLTAEGAARVNAHMATLPPSFRPRVCKAGDAWSCQLWDLTRILGTHIGDPAPAVDNVLTLRVGDLVEVSP